MYDDLISELRERAEFLACAEPLNIKNAFAESMKQAADAIEELVATVGTAYNELANNEANKPRWIPVTERLPETRESILGKKSSKVIVAFHFDDGTQGTDTAHTLNGEWVFEDHIVVVARTITHWMQLPEPPKEE